MEKEKKKKKGLEMVASYLLAPVYRIILLILSFLCGKIWLGFDASYVGWTRCSLLGSLLILWTFDSLPSVVSEI